MKAAARKTRLPSDVFFQTIEDPFAKIVEPEPRMVNIIQGEGHYRSRENLHISTIPSWQV
jgi:hypothetical protein